MTQLDLSKLNKGAGYPVLEEVFGLDQIKQQWDSAQRRGSTFGLVRQYGMKTIDQALALLRRLQGHEGVDDGWIISVNPRNGRDQQTLDFLTQAAAQTEMSIPLCVLHVEQPVGSPNSWTGGLSAVFATLMSVVEREWWQAVDVFCCSGETLFEGPAHYGPSLRASSAWLHPWLKCYADEATREAAMTSALNALFLALHFRDPSILTDRDLALLVPVDRNTGSMWSLDQIANTGFFDRRCNAGQGMEDWHQRLHLMQVPSGTQWNWLDDLKDDLQKKSLFVYRDERIENAVSDDARVVQRGKFLAEIQALRARIEMFISEGCPSSVPLEHQEFSIPAG